MSEGIAVAPKLRYEELTERILGAAIEVHKALGPGLLESAYEECLAMSSIFVACASNARSRFL